MASRREEIVRVVREVLAPLIQADGGLLYLVSAHDNAVVLHLAGRLAGCPGNTLTTRRVIEPAIFAAAPGAQVTVTWGALIPPHAERIGNHAAGGPAAPPLSSPSSSSKLGRTEASTSPERQDPPGDTETGGY
jgi:Fe-S cluster biogenesis protein NfuA